MNEQPLSNSRTQASRRFPRSTVLLAAVIGPLAVCVATFVWVNMFGRVYGEEFSPDLFEQRTFLYYQIPLLGIQVWPIARESTTGSLERELVHDKLVSVTSKSDARWDLISDNLHGPNSPEFDAQILCEYLDSSDGKAGSYWFQWNNEHPEQAKVLWPAVAEVARAKLYVLVPTLFSVARSTPSRDALKTSLRETLAKNYQRIAANRQAQGRHERAVDLFSRALAHDPANVEALRGRAESLAALGRREKAAADLAQADKLAGKRL